MVTANALMHFLSGTKYKPVKEPEAADRDLALQSEL